LFPESIKARTCGNKRRIKFLKRMKKMQGMTEEVIKDLILKKGLESIWSKIPSHNWKKIFGRIPPARKEGRESK
jgi:hypothetical protein